eukprot:RCo010351
MPLAAKCCAARKRERVLSFCCLPTHYASAIVCPAAASFGHPVLHPSPPRKPVLHCALLLKTRAVSALGHQVCKTVCLPLYFFLCALAGCNSLRCVDSVASCFFCISQ